ncbi:MULTISPECIES: thioredoxin domain-containing protein [Allobacillus]|uniref:Thioredoxin domain-containing protein n=1 Tax=Allobacillus salarius TaxID=1955272 RepID=A0A556PPY4_9BACI|nr:thioredoxin domain-containing protein [Allobacillus salarius]TSJ66458.1 thioredoxin domain-containing protein [Allobacillus salarius]
MHKPNRLINEKSPYLLQHAYNPVDWYPWGEEAFDQAKKENKPIFLSIGYSTCHWCHVMAHESFEDEETAKLLNERFISIKVDREERPDVDSVYMKICQQMTGHGGWPMSVFMTPDHIPFYAGTYFPPKGRYGLPSFQDVVKQLYETYQNDPKQIKDVTASVERAIERSQLKASEQRLDQTAVHRGYELFTRLYDETYGGFGGAPKFPAPQNILFLLNYYNQTNNEQALQMAEHTLQAMANGGLWDHVGFGFTRYATDEKWLVPHFEKMLYDQAFLLMAYTEAYQVTRNPFYQQISEQIIQFVKREMTSEEGFFYSGIDADSEGQEGKYYVWSYEEVYQILGEQLGDLYTDAYQITKQGNFEGKNIPHLIDVDLKQVAERHQLSVHEISKQLEEARNLLLNEREKRIYPHVDDKMLTSWNAMMITALLKAAKAYQQPEYTDMASQALTFIEENMYQNSRLMARYREKDVKYKAYLDDYAYLAWAYLEYYEIDFDLTYLQIAKQLMDELFTLFWDDQEGGFFFYGDDGETLIDREKEIQEGAIPSGNSVAGVLLARLGSLTGESNYIEKLEAMYHLFYPTVQKHPYVTSFFLQSLLMTDFPSKEIVLLGNKEADSFNEFIQHYQQSYNPQLSLIAGNATELVKVAPFAEGYRQINGQTTIFVCENFSCQVPTTDYKDVIDQLFGN